MPEDDQEKKSLVDEVVSVVVPVFFGIGLLVLSVGQQVQEPSRPQATSRT